MQYHNFQDQEFLQAQPEAHQHFERLCYLYQLEWHQSHQRFENAL
jgi:hypothetical protein